MRLQRFVVILCASLAAAVALHFIVRQRDARLLQPRNTSARASQVSGQRQSRKIYPFSVIPGGAYSAEELAIARRIDAVVGAHYADFGSASVAVRNLPQDAFLYVSYRKANRIFWTSDKRRIPKGEPVLSDGKHLARARCGNRLATLPQFPVAYGPQPTEAGLNAPELPGGVDLPKAPLFAAAYDAPDLPLVDARPRLFAFPREVTGASPEAFPPAGSYFPLIVVANAPFPGVARPAVGGPGSSPGPPLISGGGPSSESGGPGSGGGTSLPPTGPPPVGIVPEPSTVAMLVTGSLNLVWLSWRKRRSARSWAKPRSSHPGRAKSA